MAATKDLKDILVIDIETVSGFEAYELLNERLQALWKHKCNFIDKEKESAELYFEKGGIFAEFGKVIVIAIGFFYLQGEELFFKVKTLADHDEKKLLSDFNQLISERFSKRKVVFCAHNGKEFDYPYLCRRMIINGLPLPEVLLNCSKKPWEVRHLDTLEMWKFGDRKNYTSLDLLAATLEVPTSKDDCDGSMVNQIYYKENNLVRIGKYCAKDVVVTAQVFLRLSGLPLLKDENINFVE